MHSLPLYLFCHLNQALSESMINLFFQPAEFFHDFSEILKTFLDAIFEIVDTGDTHLARADHSLLGCVVFS